MCTLYLYEGYDAYSYGSLLSDNPYAIGSYENSEWAHGWHIARINISRRWLDENGNIDGSMFKM